MSYYLGGNELYSFILSFFIIGMVIGLAFVVVFYLFNALGLYKLSQNRGYKNAWLAFIPVASDFVLGGIADNINACYYKKSSFRIIMVILSGLRAFLYVFYIFGMIQYMTEMISVAMRGSVLSLDEFSAFMLFSSLFSLLAIALLVFQLICQYKIYVDYAPNSATLFLVLSILLGLSPFFLFAIRNKPSASLYYANQRAQYQQAQYQQTQYQPPNNNGSQNG